MTALRPLSPFRCSFGFPESGHSIGNRRLSLQRNSGQATADHRSPCSPHQPFSISECRLSSG